MSVSEKGVLLKFFSGSREFSVEDMHRRARFWGRFLSRMPGVATIFLSGSLSQGRATITSDIDFFVVAWPGRIFTARFWILLPLLICGRLAHGEKNHARKICPNHFITADHLEIRDKNRYHSYVYAHSRFLSGDRAVWERFKAANQTWIRDHGFEFQGEIHREAVLRERRQSRIGDLLEVFFRWLQRLKHQMSRATLPKDARVWLTDTEIRLHPHPPKPLDIYVPAS